MLERLKRLRDWLYGHGLVVLVFLVGIAVGVILRLPGFTYQLTDTNAQIIGAALGAGIAVAGAIWAANVNERKRKRALKMVVVTVTHPYVELVDGRLGALGHLEGTRDVMQEADVGKLRDIQSEAQRCVGKLDRIRPAFAADAVDLLVHGHLVDAFSFIAKAANDEDQANHLRTLHHAAQRQRHFNANLDCGPCPAADFSELRSRVKHLLDVVSTVGH